MWKWQNQILKMRFNLVLMSKKILYSWMWPLTILGWFSAEISVYRSDLEVVGIFSSFCKKKKLEMPMGGAFANWKENEQFEWLFIWMTL